jgi:CRISPR/Cas system CSM-associated protein Csm3 (group 7 of RAMP superfamily)
MGAKPTKIGERIIGKIIVTATLENLTPLMIGKGEGDAADVEVMRWMGDKPYIPATSLVGKIRQALNPDSNQQYRNFFGSIGTDTKNQIQSHFIVDDLVPISTLGNDVVRRDGVKIEAKTNTAKDQAKYDYQVVEQGIQFPLRIEVTLREGMDIDEATVFLAQLKQYLSNDFYLGANSNTGLGKMKCKDFTAWHFDFPDHANQWFSYLDNGQISDLDQLDLDTDSSQLHSQAFVVKATFGLKSSLITGSYGIDGGDQSDKTQLKSRDKFVLSGKSIRGAIRHRALKIFNTLGAANAEDQIDKLFGIVVEDPGKTKKVLRGRLRVDECILPNDNKLEAKVQDRIRIDRFTGGVISGALFNSEPIWSTGKEKIELQFTIHNDPTPEEKKLLLLLLKDLWLSDLAIGGEKNIGRGVLIGQSATIFDEGKEVDSFATDGNGGLQFASGSAAKINELFQAKSENQ